MVDKIETGDHFIKFHVISKVDGFRWALMTVYGAVQQEFKTEFLSELVRSCSDESLPLLVGGDFNIIRKPSEKNNNRYHSHWPNLLMLSLKH